MSYTLKHLDASRSDPKAMLCNFATSVLNFICSPEQVEVRRLMIAEAARSGTGKLLFDKITALRPQISSLLAACMASGLLRRDDPDLAADHLGALLESQILGPLLLLVRETAPNEEQAALAARRAVAAFLRAYAPTAPPRKDPAGHNAHLLRLPPHEL
jgi:AcrR family transcriptional regulator